MRVDFGITEEGLWVPLSGFTGSFNFGGPNREHILEGLGRDFAAQIVYHRLWDASSAKEIKVDIEREHP